MMLRAGFRRRDMVERPARQHSAIMLQQSVVGAAVQTQARPCLEE